MRFSSKQICPVLLFLIVAKSCCGFERRPEGTTTIVSLVPSLTESLFAIGAGDEVIGISDYCQFPAVALTRPRLGGLYSVKFEELIRLNPKVVLLYRSQADASRRLRHLGLSSQLMGTDSVESVSENLSVLGSMTGHVEDAREAVTSFQSGLKLVRSQSASRERPRALVIVSRDPSALRNIFAAPREQYLGELLEIAGGDNVLTNGSAAAITKEQIIRTNPAVIIEAAPNADLPGTGRWPGAASSALSPDDPWSALSTVSAVQNGRVYRLTDPRASTPGTYAPEIARQLQELLFRSESSTTK